MNPPVDDVDGAAIESPRVDRVSAPSSDLVLDAARRALVLLGQQNRVEEKPFTLPKRLLVRVSKPVTFRLVAAGQALAEALEGLVGLHDQGARDVAARFELTARRLEVQFAELERQRANDRLEIARLRALTNRHMADPRSAGAPTTEPAGVAVMDDSAYVEFEQRFRGSRDEIKQRQLDALRFVEPLRGSPAPLLDLGCGRGEWLEVLRDAGISAYGVDSSEGMVADAQAMGLDARFEDALVHLEGLPEGSLQAVSAFHFAEHVPLPVLTRVLDAAFLALRPGGILLLETPNPTNLVVGSAGFYLDPTHLRQIHPYFLEFFVESRGFSEAEVHYVHPALDAETLRAGQTPEGYDPRLDRIVESAEWALFGPQDYVVVARRRTID